MISIKVESNSFSYLEFFQKYTDGNIINEEEYVFNLYFFRFKYFHFIWSKNNDYNCFQRNKITVNKNAHFFIPFRFF